MVAATTEPRCGTRSNAGLDGNTRSLVPRAGRGLFSSVDRSLVSRADFAAVLPPAVAFALFPIASGSHSAQPVNPARILLPQTVSASIAVRPYRWFGPADKGKA